MTARQHPTDITYLSFSGDDGCLGVLVLNGTHDPITAAQIAWCCGQNPGGEVLAINVERGDVPDDEFIAMAENVGRLLTKEEACKLFNARPRRL